MGFAKTRCRLFFNPPPQVPEAGQEDLPSEKRIWRWTKQEWIEIGIFSAVVLILLFLAGGEFLKALEKVQAGRQQEDIERKGVIAANNGRINQDFPNQEMPPTVARLVKKTPTSPPAPAPQAKASPEVLAKLLRRARAGEIAAQIELGDRYQTGREVIKNPATAVHWFAMAAEQGDPYAAVQVGASYDDGLGVPKNDQKAFEWYQKAVQFSAEKIRKSSGLPPPALRVIHSVACGNVGTCLYRGEGVTKDDRAAVEYLAKAAVEFGPARNLLAEMAAQGNREAGSALDQAVRMGNELSAMEKLLMTREFPAHLQSLKQRGIKFEIIIGHNTPDYVSIRIRPSPPSPKASEQIFFYMTKDSRCFVASQGGKRREIQ